MYGYTRLANPWFWIVLIMVLFTMIIGITILAPRSLFLGLWWILTLVSFFVVAQHVCCISGAWYHIGLLVLMLSLMVVWVALDRDSTNTSPSVILVPVIIVLLLMLWTLWCKSIVVWSIALLCILLWISVAVWTLYQRQDKI
jgi:hypothetical protein